MKAKEKAKELVDKFYNINDPKTNHPTNHYISRDYAKQCAIIAVDEIIKEYDQQSYYQSQFDRLSFWQEVKREINNL